MANAAMKSVLPPLLPPKLGVKPPAEAALGAPEDGVKPVDAAEALGAPKVGVNPVDAGAVLELSTPLRDEEPVDALNAGVKPDTLDLGAEGPTDALNEGVKPVL